MIVVVAGIKRSGSTAQFNMVRLVLEEHFSEINLTGDLMELKPGVNIVKMHRFDQALYNKADYIFTTNRSDQDILKSLSKFSKNEEKPLAKMREYLNKWRRRSQHMDYHEIVLHPGECIEKISEVMELPVDLDKVTKDFKAIKPPAEGYDPKTFLFSNHITQDHVK